MDTYEGFYTAVAQPDLTEVATENQSPMAENLLFNRMSKLVVQDKGI